MRKILEKMTIAQSCLSHSLKKVGRGIFKVLANLANRTRLKISGALKSASQKSEKPNFKILFWTKPKLVTMGFATVFTVVGFCGIFYFLRLDSEDKRPSYVYACFDDGTPAEIRCSPAVDLRSIDFDIYNFSQRTMILITSENVEDQLMNQVKYEKKKIVLAEKEFNFPDPHVYEIDWGQSYLSVKLSLRDGIISKSFADFSMCLLVRPFYKWIGIRDAFSKNTLFCDHITVKLSPPLTYSIVGSSQVARETSISNVADPYEFNTKPILANSYGYSLSCEEGGVFSASFRSDKRTSLMQILIFIYGGLFSTGMALIPNIMIPAERK